MEPGRQDQGHARSQRAPGRHSHRHLHPHPGRCWTCRPSGPCAQGQAETNQVDGRGADGTVPHACALLTPRSSTYSTAYSVHSAAIGERLTAISPAPMRTMDSAIFAFILPIPLSLIAFSIIPLLFFGGGVPPPRCCLYFRGGRPIYDVMALTNFLLNKKTKSARMKFDISRKRHTTSTLRHSAS